MTIRLTNMTRQAIMRSILADIPMPKLDTNQCLTKARELIQTEIAEKFPPALKAAWDNPSVRKFLYKDSDYSLPAIQLTNSNGTNSGHYVKVFMGDISPATYKVSSDTMAKAATELAEYQRLLNQRRKIEIDLRNLLYSYTTVGALKKNMPEEFHKYLPTEDTPRTNLPAINAENVLSELIRLGWPKDKAAAEAQARAMVGR